MVTDARRWALMEWSAEQEELRKAITRLGRVLSANRIDLDRQGEFSWEKWRQACESGILRLPFDLDYGGLGQGLVTTMYVLEGLGYSCEDAGLSFVISTHMVSVGVPLQRFGTPEQRKRFLTRICDGDGIGAHAVTEAESGSDALSMRTTAVRRGDGWVLNGSKTFVSNGPIADLFIVYAVTDRAAGALGGITAFLVERGAPGFTIGKPIDKMGLRTAPLGELFFDECLVADDRVIGRPGLGFPIFDYVMKWEVLCSFIISVGEMQRRFEKCVEYARTRKQFGKSIGSFQSVANRIVDMKIGVETSREWLFRAARKFERNENVTVDLAIAKLVTSEYNVEAALNAIRVFGGNGYMIEYGVEKDLRDAVGGLIYSGTSEIQRNRIARMIGL